MTHSHRIGARATAVSHADMLDRYGAHTRSLVITRVRLAAVLYASAGLILTGVDMAVRGGELVALPLLPAGSAPLALVACAFYVGLLGACFGLAAAFRSPGVRRAPDRVVMTWWIAMLAVCLLYFALTGADRSLVAFWVMGSGMTAALVMPWSSRRQLAIATAGVVAYLAYLAYRAGVAESHSLPAIYPLAAVTITSVYSIVGVANVDRIRFKVFEQLAELKALRRREQLAVIGEAAAKTFHQIKQVHGTIGLLAQVLTEQGGLAEVPDIATKIKGCTAEGRRIVNELLDCARPREVDPQPCLVRDVLEHCVASCRPRAAQRSVAVELTRNGDAGTLRIDAFRIGQAVKNIIDNAVDASPSGQRVDVRLTTRSDEVEIEVRDHGTGMPQEVEAELLTPFVTSKADGMGLGLIVSHEIVEAHGGSLTWTHRDPGMSFTVILPRLPADRPEVSGATTPLSTRSPAAPG